MPGGYTCPFMSVYSMNFSKLDYHYGTIIMVLHFGTVMAIFGKGIYSTCTTGINMYIIIIIILNMLP